MAVFPRNVAILIEVKQIEYELLIFLCIWRENDGDAHLKVLNGPFGLLHDSSEEALRYYPRYSKVLPHGGYYLSEAYNRDCLFLLACQCDLPMKDGLW